MKSVQKWIAKTSERGITWVASWLDQQIGVHAIPLGKAYGFMLCGAILHLLLSSQLWPEGFASNFPVVLSVYMLPAFFFPLVFVAVRKVFDRAKNAIVLVESLIYLAIPFLIPVGWKLDSDASTWKLQLAAAISLNIVTFFFSLIPPPADAATHQ